MATSESKGRFFLQNESIRIMNRIDSNRELECSTTNRKQFWLSGSPEVTTDGAIRQETIFPIFIFRDHMPISRRFGVTAKKTKLQKNENWLPWQRPLGLKIRKSRFRSFIYSIAEPNGENRVNIRTAEVEIIGLTEIAKKERNMKHQ